MLRSDGPRYRIGRQTLAFLLCFVMLWAVLPAGALAQESLCEHHPYHNSGCGYNEIMGYPCTFTCAACAAQAQPAALAQPPDAQMQAAASPASPAPDTEAQPAASPESLAPAAPTPAPAANPENPAPAAPTPAPAANPENPAPGTEAQPAPSPESLAPPTSAQPVFVEPAWEGLARSTNPNNSGDMQGLTLREVLEKFEPFEVQGTDELDQVTLHVFDYWLDETNGRYANDYVPTKSDGLLNSGINNGHQLKFVHDADPTIVLNTGGKNSPNPPYGYVQNTLGADGYPVLSSNGTGAIPESLRYLFDPYYDHVGKESFANVTGLFQRDSDGYYYYNSMQESTEAAGNVGNTMYSGRYASANYAFLDESESDNPRFRLYENWGGWLNINKAGVTNLHGQFFPFNPPTDVFALSDGVPVVSGGKLDAPVDNDTRCGTSTFNHYMGLYLEVPFIQTPNGKDPVTGEDMTFYFSGDDDTWLFVDGVLVGDLSGIHDASTMSINFADGKVVLKGTGSGGVVTHTTTIRDRFQAAGRYDSSGFTGDTFADGTRHVIKLFYLERGNNASNLGLQFNLVNIPTAKLVKVDEDGKPIEGAQFTIYDTNDNYEIQTHLVSDGVVFSGMTDAKGEMKLLDENDFPIPFSEWIGKYGHHYLMRETAVPDGYRSAGDMHLVAHYMENGALTLVSDPNSKTGSKWNTGSYARAHEYTSVNSRNVHLRNATNDEKGEAVVEDNVLTSGGSLFAVVLKWVGSSGHGKDGSPDLLVDEVIINDHHNWWPVYRDKDTEEYHLVEVDYGNYSDSEKEKAYNAAIAKAINEDPNLFEISTATGLFEVEIDHLPGDILHYLHARTDDSEVMIDGKKVDIMEYPIQYAIFYGWTDAPKETIETPNANLEAYQFKRLYSDEFTRVFSADFVALNTKDALQVRKTDSSGNPLAGAEFALYAAGQTTESGGKVIFNNGATPDYSSTTESNGMLRFPTNPDEGLKAGRYYLFETAAPSGGYLSNGNLPVQVIVDDTGVYAHAGTANDGITVERGVGKLVETMHDFGISNDLDETLYNIKFLPQTAAAAPANGAAWDWNPVGSAWTHLHHEENANVHGYVATVGDRTVYTADAGWSRLRIEQCETHNHPSTIAYKENLTGYDITNLFTREVTVVVDNLKEGETRPTPTPPPSPTPTPYRPPYNPPPIVPQQSIKVVPADPPATGDASAWLSLLGAAWLTLGLGAHARGGKRRRP